MVLCGLRSVKSQHASGVASCQGKRSLKLTAILAIRKLPVSYLRCTGLKQLTPTYKFRFSGSDIYTKKQAQEARESAFLDGSSEATLCLMSQPLLLDSAVWKLLKSCCDLGAAFR